MPKSCATHIPLFPVPFAAALRDLCAIHTFVETGTYAGDTAVTVAPHFDRVYSIEGCRERYEAVLQRTDLPQNVAICLGDSAKRLGHLLRCLDDPAIIFLDAHWIYTGGPAKQDAYQEALSYCPLRGELEAVRDGDVVLIDDAHFFTHPPVNRGDVEQYLSLDQIVALLSGRYVFIHEGILCAVPEGYRVRVRQWLQTHWRGLQRYITNQRTYGGNSGEFEAQDEAAL